MAQWRRREELGLERLERRLWVGECFFQNSPRVTERGIDLLLGHDGVADRDPPASPQSIPVCSLQTCSRAGLRRMWALIHVLPTLF